MQAPVIGNIIFWILLLVVLVGGGLYFVFSGRDSNRRRIQRALDAANSAGENVDRAAEQNKELRELADDISRDNSNALAANRRSQEILRSAKKRASKS